MEGNLYSFEEAVEAMETAGLARRERKDDFANKFRQFGVDCSSMHIKTAKLKRYVLYATVSDWSLVLQTARDHRADILLIELHNKVEIEKLLEEIEANNRNAIVFIKEGNRILHDYSENPLVHEIRAYTNDNFRIIIEGLAKNPVNRGCGGC